MTKTEAREKFKIPSEAIEPAFASMIGVMFARYIAIKETGGDVVEAAQDFWAVTECINLLTILLSSCHHASIAIGNEQGKIASMIKEDIGVDPICDYKRLKMVEFTKNQENWYGGE